jgi:Arc/MetJ-type ribon-helix-helix transcriptional regulator
MRATRACQIGIEIEYQAGILVDVSIQIAVRLPDDTVHQLDELVAAGEAPSRASVIERALAREFRRLIAAKDAAILAKAGSDADMDSLADYAARATMDIE